MLLRNLFRSIFISALFFISVHAMDTTTALKILNLGGRTSPKDNYTFLALKIHPDRIVMRDDQSMQILEKILRICDDHKNCSRAMENAATIVNISKHLPNDVIIFLKEKSDERLIKMAHNVFYVLDEAKNVCIKNY